MRYVFGFALALVVLALGGVEWASPEGEGPMSRGTKVSIRAISTVILIALAFIGGQLGAGIFVILVMLVFVVQVLFDIKSRVGSNPDNAHEEVVS